MSDLVANLRLDFVDNETRILVDEIVDGASHMRRSSIEEVFHLDVGRGDVEVDVGAFDAQLLVARWPDRFDGR